MRGITEKFLALVRRLHARGGFAQSAPQAAVDLAIWLLAVPTAVWLRFEFDVPTMSVGGVGLVLLVTLGMQLAFGFAFSLYRNRYSYGSFDEVVGLTCTVVGTSIAVGIPLLFLGPVLSVPRSTMMIATPLAFVGMAASRYLKRLVFERGQRPAEHAAPTLVYGAGLVGSQLARSMRTDPDARFRAVGIIDDAPQLQGAVRHGVKVLGALDDLEFVVAQTGATHVVVAIARAEASLLRLVNDRATACGMQVLVMPPLSEVLEGRSQVTDLRSISIEDLVGRHPVDTDVASIAEYLRGRRVLVTGAGGSIGAELCLRGPTDVAGAHREDPESALHEPRPLDITRQRHPTRLRQSRAPRCLR